MKQIFLSLTIFLVGGIAHAGTTNILGSFSGPADYKNDEGGADSCSLDVGFTKEENTLTFSLSTHCSELEFDQAIPFDLQGNDVYYNGEKVGTYSDQEIIVKGMKVDADDYSLHASLKEDGSLDYFDKYCYNGEVCEELMGTLSPQR